MKKDFTIPAGWVEKFVSAVAPAGAVWSTVLDMAKYLMLELGKGRMSVRSSVSRSFILRP